MALASGTRLGPYEVLSPVGAGGMGEVYRARDPRLGRDVAIKVLPEDVSADPDRLRRFEQEARAAAALNHPNILTVHEFGTHGGQKYVVSELLEGETLREALGRGALSVRKTFDFARQIGQGLAAAHERGIVHRDLKPENVFVTSDDRVKILDFGLAKLLETVPSGAGASTLATAVGDTTPGTVFGTVGYMSPEQVRGQPLDYRSDIFSFGSTLYEMFSGTRAFAGETAVDTLSAILSKDPPELAITQRQLAPGVERIIRRCLEKSPQQRFRSAMDVVFALEAAMAPMGPDAPAPPAHGRGRRVAFGMAMVATLGVLIGAAVMWAIVRGGRTAPIGSTSLIEVARLTHDAGFSDSPTWSPDGTVFAFSSNRSGNFEIYVRRVEGGQEVNITNDPSDDIQPAFSPDGTAIAFISTRSSRTPLVKIGTGSGTSFGRRTYGGDLWVAPALGGRARRIAEDANYPAWRPDGRAIAFVSGEESHRSVLEVPAEGGALTPLVPGSTSSWEISRLSYSPDGSWLTFETTDRKVLTLRSGGGVPRELLVGQSHAWDTAGRRLYYIKVEPAGGTRLYSAEIQTREGNLAATSSPVGLITGWLGDLAMSADGRHLLASELEESLNLTRLPLAPGGGGPSGPEEELNPSGQVRDGYPAVSPDGRRILLVSNRLGEQQLWTLDVESRNWERLQVPETTCRMQQGSWAPDGSRVAATCSPASGTLSVWLLAVDGSATRELVSRKPALAPGNFFVEFSPDGRALLYGYLKDGFNQLFLLDLASNRERQLTTSRFDKYAAKWSPDGGWIVYSSASQVWKIPSEGGPEQVLTSGVERMRHVFYSPDGRWIYVQPSHRNIYRLQAGGGPMQRVTTFPESGLFIEEPTISRDGRFLVYSRSRGGSSLWLLTLGTPPA